MRFALAQCLAAKNAKDAKKGKSMKVETENVKATEASTEYIELIVALERRRKTFFSPIP